MGLKHTDMPDDYWPDEMWVIGELKDGDIPQAKFGFLITKEQFLDGMAEEAILGNLLQLRVTLWQAKCGMDLRDEMSKTLNMASNQMQAVRDEWEQEYAAATLGDESLE